MVNTMHLIVYLLAKIIFASHFSRYTLRAHSLNCFLYQCQHFQCRPIQRASCITFVNYFIGIIESDDIKAITDEIDRAINYSQRASSLVDTVKNKYSSKGSNKVYQLLLFSCITSSPL